MKRFLLGLFAAAVAASALADQKISLLPAAGPLVGTESIPAVQPGSCTATGGTCQTTPAAIATYVDANGNVAATAGGTGTQTAPGAAQVPVGNSGGGAYTPKTITGDVALASTGASTVTGVHLSAPLAVGSGGTGATSLATANIPIFSGTPVPGNCVNWLSATVIQDAGTPCGSGGGSSAWSALTSGTNTAGAFIIGTGASLGVTGSGTIGATSVPVAGVSGLGTGVGTFLATPTSANLAGALTNETGTGVAVFSISPALTTPTIAGSSTGATTIGSANASATNYTATLPANTGTLSELNLAQSWTALQSFAASDIAIAGTTVTGVTGTGSAVLATSPTITTPTVSGNLTTNITGSTQCVHASTTGVLSGTGSDCGSGGSTAFSALTGSTNTTAAMVVGTGASLAASGSGTITATAAPVTGISGLGTGVVTFLQTPSSSNLASAVTGATGSGALVFGTAPTIGLVNGTGLPLTGLATQASNTIDCNATGGSASPTACSPATTIGVLNSTTANAQTGTSYTPVIGDANLFITMSNASANTFCIPPNSSVAYAVGTTLTVEELGAGITTVAPAGASGCAGTGVTVTSVQYGSSTSQTYALAGIYDLFQMRQISTNNWLVTGVGPGRMLQSGVVNLASTSFGGVTGTLPGANMTATNLASSANGGVSGTLPLANGGTGTTGVTSVSTATSITPNCIFGMAKITASATGTFTVNAPGTCTPFDGQHLTLKVTSPAGGTITYSWNATYLASATLALPTTSNAASKEDYFGFQWDSDKSGWVYLASNEGF